MPAHIVHGDPFLTARAIRGIRTGAGVHEQGASIQEWLQADQTSPEQLINACNTRPFLEKSNVVMIEGVLTTKERSRQPAGDRPTKQKRKSKEPSWEQVADTITRMHKTTVLIMLDEKVSSTNTLFKKLSPHCTVHDEKLPAAEALTRWVTTAAREKNSRIRPDAARLLVELAGTSLWTLDQELEKLSLYCDQREITVEEIKLLIDDAKEANIFAAIDAIVSRQTGPALRMVAQLMANGTEPLTLMGMIDRQLRLMALATDLTARGVPQKQWDRSLGFTSEFVSRKTAEQAMRKTKADLTKMYDHTLKTDLAIKNGILAPDTAVELLTATLSQT